MSHWVTGKIDIKVSVAQMARVLRGIMPQWEEHIEVNQAGEAVFYGYTGKEKGFHIIVHGPKNPKSHAPGLRWNDIAMKKLPDGKWDIRIDPAGIPESLKYYETTITREVLRDRASSRGWKIVFDEQDDRSLDFKVLVPVGQEFMKA